MNQSDGQIALDASTGTPEASNQRRPHRDSDARDSSAHVLTVVPLTLKKANAFVESVHRHHGPVPGGLDFFRIGAIDEDGVLRGVAIVSRPPNRNSDDGLTCEVVRLATDGGFNCCSFLYGASARIARTMGFVRIITYTLDEESGASLRASGWTEEKNGIRSWWQSNQTKGRSVKAREHYAKTKTRWAKQLVML